MELEDELPVYSKLRNHIYYKFSLYILFTIRMYSAKRIFVRKYPKKNRKSMQLSMIKPLTSASETQMSKQQKGRMHLKINFDDWDARNFRWFFNKSSINDDFLSKFSGNSNTNVSKELKWEKRLQLCNNKIKDKLKSKRRVRLQVEALFFVCVCVQIVTAFFLRFARFQSMPSKILEELTLTKINKLVLLWY